MRANRGAYDSVRPSARARTMLALHKILLPRLCALAFLLAGVGCTAVHERHPLRRDKSTDDSTSETRTVTPASSSAADGGAMAPRSTATSSKPAVASTSEMGGHGGKSGGAAGVVTVDSSAGMSEAGAAGRSSAGSSAGAAGVSSAGRGGSSGGGGSSGSGGTSYKKFSPLCSEVPPTAAGPQPGPSGACTASDTQICYEPCGPKDLGVRTETCVDGAYVGQPGLHLPGR